MVASQVVQEFKVIRVQEFKVVLGRTTHYESSGEQIIPDPVVPLPSPLKKPIRVSLTQCACSLHRLPLLQKKQRLYCSFPPDRAELKRV